MRFMQQMEESLLFLSTSPRCRQTTQSPLGERSRGMGVRVGDETSMFECMQKVIYR